MNCVSVFDHFVGFALKGLISTYAGNLIFMKLTIGCFKKSCTTLNVIFSKNVAGHITLNCYFHKSLIVADYSEQLFY